jgi:predicted GIY-YIG superfamily endonuclease
MPFWTYMLQCADRSFYVGHTDDLETRLSQHQPGTFKGYTETRRPVHLVWAAESATRDEARTFELRLKGWSRAKKLALIRGDWAAVSELARSRQEEVGRASTGSAQPALGQAPISRFLHPHLALLPSEPFSLQVIAMPHRTGIRTRFLLTGTIAQLRIPPLAPPTRRDNLWQRTCFELFAQAGAGYVEYNLSPSAEWSAYRFTGYREGMAELDVAPPRISVARTEHRLELSADMELPSDVTRIGLAAVIEELDGTKSYWALRHPPGDKPDFHHPDCFALELPSQ